MDRIENRTFDEIKLGTAQASSGRSPTKTSKCLRSCPATSTPLMWTKPLPTGLFHRIVANGMWGTALISRSWHATAGPGSVHVDQSLHFPGSVGPGDTITVTVKVAEQDEKRIASSLNATCPTNVARKSFPHGRRHRADRKSLDHALLFPISSCAEGTAYHRLIEMTRGLAPISRRLSPSGRYTFPARAIEAARAQTHPAGAGWAGGQDSRRAAQAGWTFLLMKSLQRSTATLPRRKPLPWLARQSRGFDEGALHTEELMHAVVDTDVGLPPGKRISHVFAIDAPLSKPSLSRTPRSTSIRCWRSKRDIIQNAMDLVHALGIPQPKSGHPVGGRNRYRDHSLHPRRGGALARWRPGSDHRRHSRCPLAFDNAVSAQSAKTKGIVSPVGRPCRYLVVPDLEAGNMLAKQLEYLAEAQMAGIVLGARVPIILTQPHRMELLARLGSCAIALLLARNKTMAAS